MGSVQEAVQTLMKMVSLAEEELFTGSFRESVVKSDLASRPEKREFYINEFNEWEKSMDTVLGALNGNPTAGTLIARAQKNKNQAHTMLTYVRGY